MKKQSKEKYTISTLAAILIVLVVCLIIISIGTELKEFDNGETVCATDGWYKLGIYKTLGLNITNMWGLECNTHWGEWKRSRNKT